MALHLKSTGIDFTDFSDATESSELLDDYEEGTWTPSLSGTGFTYQAGGADAGWYRKIGAWVMCGCRIHGSVTSGSGTAAVRYITGIPFARPGSNTNQVIDGVSYGWYNNNSGAYGNPQGNGAATSTGASNIIAYGTYSSTNNYYVSFAYPVDT